MTNTQVTRTTPSKDIDAAVGERIHMMIWNQKRTNGSVAGAIGIDPGTFGRKLRGERKWALVEVVAIAAELDTTVGHLLGERPVGPTGLEPMTSTVESLHFATVTSIDARRSA